MANPVGITAASTDANTVHGNTGLGNKGQQDSEMRDVVSVKQQTPVTPEVQALNVALKEVGKMLTQALPISKRLRLASAFGGPSNAGHACRNAILVCIFWDMVGHLTCRLDLRNG